MPSHKPRMSKRLSQAPRLSVVVMAGSEVPAEDYKRGNVKEFCSNHVKTIATLVMILGTILCIVLIVMVHKWRYESNELAKIQACLDVAVVGGGIAGSYAAWKLRNAPVRVHVFEATDHLGGRFHTHRFGPEFPDLAAELGALYYLPQSHPRLNRTIRALKLEPVPYRPQNQDLPTYYLRHHHLTTNDFLQTRGVPYYLRFAEKYKTPEELKEWYSSKHVEGSSTDPLLKSVDGVPLYKMGLWNYLSMTGSKEGFNLLSDSTPWRGFLGNGNAALLANFSMGDNHEQFTLKNGMDSLPNALIEEFLNASDRNGAHKNMRLACIQKQDGYFLLFFAKTETDPLKGTRDIRKTKKICARQVILAIPPDAITQLKWIEFPPYQVNALHDMAYNNFETTPAASMYFLYNNSFWVGATPEYPDVITDLPLRQVRYVRSQRSRFKPMSPEWRGEEAHLYMVANVAGRDVDYIRAMLSKSVQEGEIKLSCNHTLHFINDIHRQIAKIQRIPVSQIPLPVRVIFKDWSRTPSMGGWQMWKRGVNWRKVNAKMRKPMRYQDIFVAGSPYCAGNCSLWAEGALQTVDDLMHHHFNKQKIQELDELDHILHRFD